MTATTRSDDRTYDLISVAYHALQAGDTYEQYIRDAEGRDDQEAAEFFRDLQQKQAEIADRAKQLISARLHEA